MARELRIIRPEELRGPRSFFTDLDPADGQRDPTAAVRSLKLQLLLKTKVIVGASSLFHTEWLEIFRHQKGLTGLLNDGSLVPALRDEFQTIDDFFIDKSTYHEDARLFFAENTGAVLPWSLEKNSEWFFNCVLGAIADSKSVLRVQTSLSPTEASRLAARVKELRLADKYFKRSHAEQAAREICPEHEAYVSNFAGLVYRVSGARVVKAEGHYPQANLIGVGITPCDIRLSDESIFWDMFVDAVMSYLNSATALTIERIDRLGFGDIADLRAGHLSQTFAEKFDEILKLAKGKVDVHDPASLFLTCQEMEAAADHLKRDFYDALGKELKARAFEDRLPGLFEIASAALEWTVSGPAGAAIGLLTNLLAIPEMTAAIDKKLSERLRRRLDFAKSCLKRVVGLSHQKRTALISMYQKLLLHGFE